MATIKDMDIILTWSDGKTESVKITDLPFNVEDYKQIKKVLKEYESWNFPNKEDVYDQINKTIENHEKANYLKM
tara:strand:+ start:185 stop:406 length:222 start_codon:yes stop_codon:yes gene_type:complete